MSVARTSKEMVVSSNTNTGRRCSFILSPKSYRVGVVLLLGCGGAALLNFGFSKCWEARTLGSMAAVASGSLFAAISSILGIYEFFLCMKKSEPAIRQTGASLLDGVRQDAKTTSGACKILGISTDQSNDQSLIAERKNKLLEEHSTSLNRALRNFQSDPTNNPASEPAPVQALRLMIADVNAAYKTLYENLYKSEG